MGPANRTLTNETSKEYAKILQKKFYTVNFTLSPGHPGTQHAMDTRRLRPDIPLQDNGRNPMNC